MPDESPSDKPKAPQVVGEKPPAGRAKKILVRIVIYIVGSYLLLCLLLFLMQNKLVFQPSKVSELKPQAAGYSPQQAAALETKTSDGLTLRGWHLGGGKPRAKGNPTKISDAALVVLFFTGNAGNRGDRMGAFKQLSSLGVNVVCFDYRGYGDSDGSPDEEGLGRDARAAWDYLRAQNVPAERIVIQGESLGGAVAIRLASELCAEGTPPGGLLTEATFTRLPDVAGKIYWYVPVSLLLRSKFPSVERIVKVTCPIQMIHGEVDELIPFSLGQQLFAAAPEKSASGVEKNFVAIKNATHNDVPFANPSLYRETLGAFYTLIAPELEHKPREIVAPRTPEQMKSKPKEKVKGPEFPKGREPVLAPKNNKSAKPGQEK